MVKEHNFIQLEYHMFGMSVWSKGTGTVTASNSIPMLEFDTYLTIDMIPSFHQFLLEEDDLYKKMNCIHC